MSGADDLAAGEQLESAQLASLMKVPPWTTQYVPIVKVTSDYLEEGRS